MKAGDQNNLKGLLIAGVGLPGSGKTTLFSAMSEILGAKLFVEPGERYWDRSVHQRDTYGHIGGLHWFRSQRVPNIFDARKCADEGQIVFLDSFYDKLCYYYLGKKGMEWLIDPKDPYFSNYLETARLDLEYLPDADLVISINVTKNDWIKMLKKRNRKLDNDVKLENTFHTQPLFENAEKSYCREKSIDFLEFNNTFSSIEASSNFLISNIKNLLINYEK